MHTRTRMALVAAMAASLVGSAYARTITVTENKEGGETMSSSTACPPTEREPSLSRQ